MMSIRSILVAAGIAVATAAVAAPAYSALPPPPTSYDYSITGFLPGNQVISGAGIATVTGTSITGIDFSAFSLGGGSTSYLEYVAGSSTGNIEATTSGGPSGAAIVLSYAGPSIFTGAGGFASYTVLKGGSLGTVTGDGSALVADVRISPVPLPGAVVLFGSAVVALGGFARLRRRKEV